MKKTKFIIMALIISPLIMVGQFKLADLPYKYNALEPYIDSTTMYIHYNNHHAGYVSNLNKALAAYPELYQKELTELLKNLNELPTDIQTVVRNNGGGHYNHNLFWSFLTPANKSVLSKKMEQKLIDNFGSVEAFKTEFEKAATSRFGSGWAWLIKEPSGKLRIISTPNQDNPLMNFADAKGKPVLALDVWEHAYYLKYQSKRAAYVKAFWSIVNWDEVEKLSCE